MDYKGIAVVIVFQLIILFSGCKVPQHGQTESTIASGDTLAYNFLKPPQQYGIRCWWWWLNGNVTKEAITRDLTEMKAKGFSGACLFDAGGQTQRGNGDVPEGPMFGSPAWRELYMHAVKEADRLGLVLSLSIQSGWNLGGPDVTPEEATKHLTWSEITVKGPLDALQQLPLPIIRDDFYRDIVVLAFPKRNIPVTRVPIRDLALKAAFVEGHRSGFDNEKLLDDTTSTVDEQDAVLKEIIVLENKLDDSGKLSWKVPPGEWTVMRFGFTTSDADVSTSSGKWQGKVIDYMNAQYFNRYWNTHVDPLLKMIGPMAGKTLRYLQTDSWELGGINWSDHFASEFSKRRGYSVYPYLPVIAGKIINDRIVSNAFLADFRKTIGDCIAENHYKIFSERAREYGMGIQPESAGPHSGPIDGLKNYGYSELMMSEFWSPSPHRSTPDEQFFVKQAASAAQIYNKRLVGAEAFTTIGRHWNDVPWATMKPPFDREVCSGLNLTFLHTFTCSPKEMGLPGQEYFAGTHLNPNITWWNMAGEVFDYFKRCQYLLQKGNIVSDVLFYYGDQVPNIGHFKAFDPANVLPGYDYDLINEDRLMVLSVKNGLIALPHGITYKVLVLPELKTLSMEALTKVRELVIDGATVVGAKPLRMVSLSGNEMTFKNYADELWGKEITKAGEKRTGQGTVIWGKPVREVLVSKNILPDLESIEKLQPDLFDYIHRSVNGLDIYFLSSQNKQEISGSFTFRITGKQPELWNALTGEVREAKAFNQKNGRTTVPLQFDPYGSVFVIFRKTIPQDQQGNATHNAIHYKSVTTINGPWKVKFDSAQHVPAVLDFPSLQSWTLRSEENIQYYSGKATYSTTFNVSDFKNDERYFLTLGAIEDVGIARVRLNNKEIGITWTPPFRMEISSLLQKKDNKLEVDVINSWRNRLVGDRELPAQKRFTRTNITIKPEWQLLDAGLLGPVSISVALE
jgi:hypothetical protein